MATFEKYAVLDREGMNRLLADIFRTVEATYVRRSVYEADMYALSERIGALAISDTYNFSVHHTSGDLIFRCPDSTEVDLAINSEGYLIMNSNDTNTDKVISQYHFEVDEDGYLIATI